MTIAELAQAVADIWVGFMMFSVGILAVRFGTSRG